MFQDVVQGAIRQVDSWLNLPADETNWQQVGEDCRALLGEIERKALMAGLSDAVPACQVVGATASAQQTRQILAECLAAYQPEPVDALLLTVKQASERYNIGERTLYRLLQQGNLQNYGPGSSKRIKPSDLDQYLERQAQPVAARPSLFD